MIHRIAFHAVALSLAALVTVSGLAGMDKLADSNYASAMFAAEADAAPVQQVVIVGQRAPRG